MNIYHICLVITSLSITVQAMENQQPLHVFSANAEVYHLAGNVDDGIYAGLSNSLVQRFYNAGKNESISFYSLFPSTGYWPQTVVVDGNELIVTDENRTVIADKNDCTQPFKTIYRTTEPWGEIPQTLSVAVANNNYYVGDNCGYICVYDKKTGEKRAVLKTDEPRCDCIWELKELDGKLASSSLPNYIQVWDLETNKNISSFTDNDAIIDFGDIVFTKEYSNSPLVFYTPYSGEQKKQINVLDTASNKIIKNFVGDKNISSLCIGSNTIFISGESNSNPKTSAYYSQKSSTTRPNKHALASTDSNATTHINIWDFASGRQIFHVPAHDKIITGIIDLGNDTFASSSSDKTVKIWSKAVLTQIIASSTCSIQ